MVKFPDIKQIISLVLLTTLDAVNSYYWLLLFLFLFRLWLLIKIFYIFLNSADSWYTFRRLAFKYWLAYLSYFIFLSAMLTLNTSSKIISVLFLNSNFFNINHLISESLNLPFMQGQLIFKLFYCLMFSYIFIQFFLFLLYLFYLLLKLSLH